MKNICITVILLVFTVQAHAKKVKCVDSEDSALTLVADFNSLAPSLAASVISYRPDGSIDHESKTEYLSSKSVCNAAIDFPSECTSKEQNNSLGYSYQFFCKTKKIFGEFYVDENGNGNFSCNNQTGSSLFFGCKIQ